MSRLRRPHGRAPRSELQDETDDLRESPYVTLAETLIGKGFNVRIHDPIVNPSRLVGSNRTYINAKLPHLRRLLTARAARRHRGCRRRDRVVRDPAVATPSSRRRRRC